MAHPLDISHHIKALPPALQQMQSLGYSARDCMAGTGLNPEDLVHLEQIGNFKLEQEFRFHRNLLELSGDPLLGLKLGGGYSPEHYGLFGYAFLSAATLRHALTIARNFGPLSFTLFKVEFLVSGASAALQFARNIDIPADLVRYYVDRDLAAVVKGGKGILPDTLGLTEVSLMHEASADRQAYEDFFGCPVRFGTALSQLRFDAAVLDTPMPMRDTATSSVCQQQCQFLLARMSKSSGFTDSVRQLIVARPGFFPDIDYIAERLGTTSRTLRRKLNAEGSSYQQILSAVRYQLAREYLSTSSLPLEEISVLLGYSSPGNFTNAFKRWHGSSPRRFRQESR
jgi:AraC-like DNA-binding protein